MRVFSPWSERKRPDDEAHQRLDERVEAEHLRVRQQVHEQARREARDGAGHAPALDGRDVDEEQHHVRHDAPQAELLEDEPLREHDADAGDDAAERRRA